MSVYTIHYASLLQRLFNGSFCLWDKTYSALCDGLTRPAFLTCHIYTWISCYFQDIHLQAFAKSTHCLKCPSSLCIPNSYFPISLIFSRKPFLALFVPPTRYSFSVFPKHSNLCQLILLPYCITVSIFTTRLSDLGKQELYLFMWLPSNQYSIWYIGIQYIFWIKIWMNSTCLHIFEKLWYRRCIELILSLNRYVWLVEIIGIYRKL